MKKMKILEIPNENEEAVTLYREGLLKKKYFLSRFRGRYYLPLNNALKIIECIEWGLKNPPVTPSVFHLGGQGGYRLDVSGGGRKFHLYEETKEWKECTPVENYRRANDDGRCLACEGWGCCDCRHTGGY